MSADEAGRLATATIDPGKQEEGFAGRRNDATTIPQPEATTAG